MKKLALALMFCCGAAYGQGTEWVARAKNSNGGLIVLLDVKGPCSIGKRIYTATTTGDSIWGCWFATDNHIIVTWDGRSNVTTYDYSGWEINPIRQDRPKPSGNSF